MQAYATAADAALAFEEWNRKANAAADAYNAAAHPWNRKRFESEFRFCADMRDHALRAFETLRQK